MKHFSWLFAVVLASSVLGCSESADCPDAVSELEQTGQFSSTTNALEGAGPTVVFSGGPTTGAAPLNVYLDGTKSKPQVGDGSWISSCLLDYGDGTSTTSCWGTHSYAAGSYTATFTATDNLGRSTQGQVAINVSGTPADAGSPADSGTPVDSGTPADAGSPADSGTPVDSGTPADAGSPVDAGSPSDAGTPTGGPTATLTGGPVSGAAPLSVYLDGTQSKPQVGDGSWIATCSLAFGDGATTTNCWGSHVYAAGTWTAVFTATDSKGRSAQAQLTIVVTGSGSDAGTPVDAGTPTDAGTPVDAGTPTDAGAPVDSGTPDSGTPPDTEVLHWYSSAQGLPWARNASRDEGGNIWVVNDNGVYVKRPGDTGFSVKTGFGQLAKGDWPYTICGGAANQAYVGYVGPEIPDALGGTPEERLRGDMDRIALNAGTGAVSLQFHYAFFNTNDPQYNEVQTIVSCNRQNNPASTDYGTVYIGSNHAVTRIQGDKFADHRHVVWAKPSGTLVIGYNWATALAPTGNLFFANEYKIGELKPTPVLKDWLSFSINPWVIDTYVPPVGTLEDNDFWHAAAVTPDGKHWVGSWTKGLVWMTPTPRVYTVIGDAPETRINALAAESDNSIWVGTQTKGLWKRSAAGSWTKLNLPLGTSTVLGLYLDTRTTPRTLFISTNQGLATYTGP